MKTKILFLVIAITIISILYSCVPKTVYVENLEYNGLVGDGIFANTIGATYGDTVLLWETYNFDAKEVTDNFYCGLMKVEDWNKKTKNFGDAIVVWHYGGNYRNGPNDWIATKTVVSKAVVVKN